jgi:hypothetical protein
MDGSFLFNKPPPVVSSVKIESRTNVAEMFPVRDCVRELLMADKYFSYSSVGH